MSFRVVPIAAGLLLAVAGCNNSITGSGTGAGPDEAAGMAAVGNAGEGTCGAIERQVLVGESVTVLNDAELPDDARVLFPGAAVTQDFMGARLNIEIGTDDRISRIYCG